MITMYNPGAIVTSSCYAQAEAMSGKELVTLSGFDLAPAQYSNQKVGTFRAVSCV